MSDDRPLLSIRASGPAAGGGRLSLAEFARIAGEFQATVERIALGLRGLPKGVDPRSKNIVQAVGMDIRSFTSAPAVLTVGRIADPLPEGDILADSLEILETGLAAIARYQQAPDIFTAPILDGLLRLASGVADKTVSTVDVQRGGRTTISFNPRLYAQLRAVRGTVSVTEKVLVGRLQINDLARSALRCRIDTLNSNVSCAFGEELTGIVLAAAGSLVRVRGLAESTADGSIRTFEIHGLETLPDSPHRTFDDLAREQGVTPVASVGELALAEPLSAEEYEEFLAAAMSARGDRPSP